MCHFANVNVLSTYDDVLSAELQDLCVSFTNVKSKYYMNKSGYKIIFHPFHNT